MRIGLAGPIATENIFSLISRGSSILPAGYHGAPLMGALIRALLQRGHDVIGFTTSSDIPPVPGGAVVAEGERFKMVYCPSRPRAFRRAGGHWGRAMDGFGFERRELRRAMQAERLDVMHAHWTYEFALAAQESGVPHLITCHDAPQVVLRYMPNPYRLVRFLMARKALNRANHLTAVSPYLSAKVQAYAKVPIEVIPNPLPQEVCDRTQPSSLIDPQRPRIAMVLNGWSRLKNPEVAFQAFGRLKERIPKARLSAMGRDFGPGELAETWARSRNLADGVEFLGLLTHEALLERLSQADLLLHPSLEESFGMSLVEAMALGVPVVGGEGSGAVPWVIGNGGVVARLSDPSDLDEGLLRVLDRLQADPSFRERTRNEAIRRFSPDKVAREYERAYERAISSVKGGSCLGS